MKKLLICTSLRAEEYISECNKCRSFTYVNQEKECLACVQKKLKNGPLLWKPPTLEKELRELEDTQSKMQEILGKL